MRWLAIVLATWLAAGTAQAQDEPAELRQQVLVMLQIRSGPGQAQARKQLALQLAREHHLAMEYRWEMPLLGVECFVLQVPSGNSAAGVGDRLSRDRRVVWAEPMGLYRGLDTASSHTDPLYGVQPNATAWHLAELHRLAAGRNVRIAVIDTAVEARHPDLAGALAWRENFVEGRFPAAEQHGTAVAGLIAARADNNVGIVGVAPQAQLMALRACWQQPGEVALCSTLTLARALQFAIDHHAQVINLSLSGPASRVLAELLDAALSRGIVLVSAFDSNKSEGGFPASHAGVLAVGDGGHAGSVGAPARDLPTTLPGARWGLVSGASYAAAQVSGLMALLLELGTAAPVAALVRGPGDAVDACASVQRSAGGCACGCGAMAHR